MDDKPKRPRPTEQPSPAADDAAERAAPTPVGDLASEAAVAAPAEMVPKDTYLRLAAEYDNFRKRTLKERTEVWSKAQADLVQRLVDALDDLARFAHIEPSAETAKTIHEGVDLVERKIWKELEAAGVRRVDQVGVPFDPNLHEAVTTAPASAPEEDHTVGAVLQAGWASAGRGSGTISSAGTGPAPVRAGTAARGGGRAEGEAGPALRTRASSSICRTWARSEGWGTCSLRSSGSGAGVGWRRPRTKSRRRSQFLSGWPRWVARCRSRCRWPRCARRAAATGPLRGPRSRSAPSAKAGERFPSGRAASRSTGRVPCAAARAACLRRGAPPARARARCASRSG